MKALIINADDMGVSAAVNDAVIRLYKAAAITGTSIIAPGEAFMPASEALRASGVSEVGAHLTLTGKFRPVSRGMGVLTDSGGYFPGTYIKLVPKLFLSGVKRKVLKEELAAQVEKIKKEGFSVTHVDSHEHVHMIPSVLESVIELCSDMAIPYVRFPFEERSVAGISFSVKDLLRHKALRIFSARSRGKLAACSISSNDHFLGHFHSGRLNGAILMAMADKIEKGVTELAVHPAVHSPEFLERSPWYANGQLEMDELMSESWKNKLKEKGITLISHSKARH